MTYHGIDPKLLDKSFSQPGGSISDEPNIADGELNITNVDGSQDDFGQLPLYPIPGLEDLSPIQLDPIASYLQIASSGFDEILWDEGEHVNSPSFPFATKSPVEHLRPNNVKYLDINSNRERKLGSNDSDISKALAILERASQPDETTSYLFQLFKQKFTEMDGNGRIPGLLDDASQRNQCSLPSATPSLLSGGVSSAKQPSSSQNLERIRQARESSIVDFQNEATYSHSDTATVETKKRRRNNFCYYCTYPRCGQTFDDKSEWKRHEGSVKHWPQEGFMCLECDISLTNPDGTTVCTFCHIDIHHGVEALRAHALRCSKAKTRARKFSRKDHFRTHLQKTHGVPLEFREAWTYSKGPVPEQCGFCGEPFNNWDERANHIEHEFRAGFTIASWKIPFPRRSHDYKPTPYQRQYKDDTDDDDIDENDRQTSRKYQGHLVAPANSHLSSTETRSKQPSPSSNLSSVDHTRKYSSLWDNSTIANFPQPSRKLSYQLRTRREPRSSYTNLDKLACILGIGYLNWKFSFSFNRQTMDSEYVRVKNLGAGSESIVDEVRHKHSSQTVARKTTTYKHPSPILLDRFRYEVSVLRELQKWSHRHVIKLIDAYTVDNNKNLTLLILPVADCNLHEFMRRSMFEGSSSAERSLKPTWFGCLASAVEFLHSHKITHGDIKPSNILIHHDNILLSDFRTATRFNMDEKTDRPNNFLYTPQYCAPEVASGMTNSPAADIFSLGCVFFEMFGICHNLSPESFNGFLTENYLKKKPCHCANSEVQGHLQRMVQEEDSRIGCWADADDCEVISRMTCAIPEHRPTAHSVRQKLAPLGCCYFGSAADILLHQNNRLVHFASAINVLDIDPVGSTSSAMVPFESNQPPKNHDLSASLCLLPHGPSPLELYIANRQDRIERPFWEISVISSPTKTGPLTGSSNTSQPSNPSTSSCMSPTKSDTSSLFSRKSHQSTTSTTSIETPSTAKFVDSLKTCSPLKCTTLQRGSSYDLPCEFEFLGCEVRFASGEIEAWISHSISHFEGLPPPCYADLICPESVCIFSCGENPFPPDNDVENHWRNRMLHMADHFSTGLRQENTEPDFYLLGYLSDHGLITIEDYAHALQWLPPKTTKRVDERTLQFSEGVMKSY